jgi:hypothetical protein
MLLMQVKWFGLPSVILIVGVILGYKAHLSQQSHTTGINAAPRVLLVAELSEASSPGDACAEIIHYVRAARDRGIAVQELEPGSKSELLARYHVLTVPTVLILDPGGNEVSRYEGEGRDTVKAVKAELEQLH